MRTDETAELAAQRWSDGRGRAVACLVLSIGAFAFVSARVAILDLSASGERPILVGAEGARTAKASTDLPLWTGKQYSEKVETPVVVPVKVRIASASPETVSPASPTTTRPLGMEVLVAAFAARPDPSSADEPDETASIAIPRRQRESTPAPSRGRVASLGSPPAAASPPAADVGNTQFSWGQQLLSSAAPGAAPARAPIPVPSAAATTVPTGARSISLKVPADVRIRGRDSFQIGNDVYRLDGLSTVVPKRVLGPRRDLRNAIAGQTLSCKSVKEGAGATVVACTKASQAATRGFSLW